MDPVPDVVPSVDDIRNVIHEFTHWDDCVELLHDKIMCWMQENKCVENWDEDCAEERFNLTDYYEGPKDRPSIPMEVIG